MLVVYALPLSRLAGTAVALPGAGWVQLLRRFGVFVLRRDGFVRLLHLPSDQYRPVVPLLDGSAVPGVADGHAAVAAEQYGGECDPAGDLAAGVFPALAGLDGGAAIDEGGLR